MSINVTRWSPDTCACVVEYAWDSEVLDKDRVHTLFKIVSKCEAHKSLSDEDVWRAVVDENPRKNKTLGLIKENHPELVDEKTKIFNSGAVSWLFDDKRILEISIPSLDVAQKNSLKGLLDSQSGIGRVRIV